MDANEYRGDHTQGRPEWMAFDPYTGEPVPESTGVREIVITDGADNLELPLGDTKAHRDALRQG